MNKIYKVIWSHIANAFVVVSELATTKGKVKSTSVTNQPINGNAPKFKLNKIALLSSLAILASHQAFAAKMDNIIVNADTATVIGVNNAVAAGRNYFVLGNNVKATQENSVYLGANSAFVPAGKTTSGMGKNTYVTLNGAYYYYAGTMPAGVVTIGNLGTERRIQNVAAGLISEKSTDAVNGSQLYALTRPLRFGGDNSRINDPNSGCVICDKNVISRGAKQGMYIKGGETDPSKLTTTGDKNVGVIVVDNHNMEVRLSKNLTNLTSATFTNNVNTTVINHDGVTINNGPSITVNGINAGNKPVTNVTSSIANKDGATFIEKLTNANTTNPNNAVNISDLKATVKTLVLPSTVGGFGLKDQDGKEFKQALGTTAQIVGDGNITTKVIDGTNGRKALEINLNPDVQFGQKGADGKDGLVGVNGKDGSAVVLNGKDGSIGLNGKDGANGLTFKAANGKDGVDGKNGTNGKTRIVYETKDANDNTTTEEVATLNDGLKFGANKGTVHNAKLNTQVNVKGAVANTDWAKFDAGKNIMTQVNGDTITVALAKNLTGLNSITLEKGTLKPTYNAGDLVIVNSKPTSATATTPTKSQAAPSNDCILCTYNNVAIIGDILNAGWNLQGNGQAVDFVKPYDTVNFANGTNTAMSAVSSVDGKISHVRVNVVGLPINYVNNAGETLVQVNNKFYKTTDVVNGVPNAGAKEQTPAGTSLVANNGSTTVPQKLANVASSIADKAGASFGDKLANAAIANPNNAVNVSDLKNALDGIKKSGNNNVVGNFGLKDQDGNEFTQPLNTTAQIVGDDNINTKVVNTANGGKALAVGLKPEVQLGQKGKPGKDGVDGKFGVNGKDGSAVVLNGKDGSIGLNGKDGANGLTFKAANGKDGVDGTNGTDGKTRIVYETKDANGKPVTEEVATLNDGLKFGANSGTTHNAKLNTQVNVKGANANTDWAKFDEGKNIMTQVNGDTITVALAKDVNVNSVTTGDTKVENKGVTINNGTKGTPVSLTKDGLNNGGNQVVNMDSGLKDATGNTINLADAKDSVLKNGVNVGDLKNAVNNITKAGLNGGFGLKDQDGNEFKQDLGTTAQIIGDGNINTKVVDAKTGGKALEVSLNPDVQLGQKGANGKDGKLGVNGKDGSAVVLNGKDGSIGLNGKDGANSLTFKAANGKDGVDGANGADGKTRIVYETKDAKGNPVTEEVATLNDGLKFGANNGTVHNAKLNTQVNVKGADANTDWTKFDEGKNIMTQVKGENITVALAKDLAGLNSITLGDNGDKTVVNKNGITIAKDPTNPNAAEVKLTEKGLDNGNNQIINVKGNLAPTYNAGDMTIGADGKPTTTAATTPTKSQAAPSPADAAAMHNNAATVGDVLNAGWNLQGNGQAVDFVKSYDTVNFANGTNTEVNVVSSADGKTNDIRVNVVGLPISYVNNAGDALVKVGDKFYKAGDVVNGVPNTGAAEQTPAGTSLVAGNGSTTAPQKLANVASSIADKAGADFGEKLANANATNPNNAVNVSDLKGAVDDLRGPSSVGGFGLKDQDGKEFKQALGTTAQVVGDDNINTKVVDTATGGKALEVSLKPNVQLGQKGVNGKDGSLGINGKDGSSVVLNGKDGSIGLTGPAGKDGKNAQATIGVEDGVKGLNGNDGKDGESKTRLVYTKPNGEKEQVATMSDGLTFEGDTGSHKAPLGTNVKVNGDGKNITTKVEGNAVKVQLNDNIEVKGATVKENLTVEKGANVDMGGNTVNNVADGEVSATSKQAVNGSQLYRVQQQINNSNTQAINNVAKRVNKVDKDLRAGIAGANAAAGLPQVYLPGKSMVAASAGTYRGESAVAVGYSRSSDNGKVIMKLQGNTNTRGDVGGSVGVGYQW